MSIFHKRRDEKTERIIRDYWSISSQAVAASVSKLPGFADMPLPAQRNAAYVVVTFLQGVSQGYIKERTGRTVELPLPDEIRAMQTANEKAKS